MPVNKYCTTKALQCTIDQPTKCSISIVQADKRRENQFYGYINLGEQNVFVFRCFHIKHSLTPIRYIMSTKNFLLINITFKKMKYFFLLNKQLQTSGGNATGTPPLQIPPLFSGAKRRKIFLLRKSLIKKFFSRYPPPPPLFFPKIRGRGGICSVTP